MFRKAASFPPEERLSFMASGRRVGGDPFNLVVREKKGFSFSVLSVRVRNKKIFCSFRSFTWKKIQSGIESISCIISLLLLYA